MKVQIWNWAADRQTQKVIEALGFEHKQIVELDIFKLAEKFLKEGGINVMILHTSDPELTFTLALDTKSFGQR